MACEEKSKLILAFDGAVWAYRAAVREMTDHMGMTSKARYQELKRASEDARLECEKARLDLELHTAHHNC